MNSYSSIKYNIKDLKAAIDKIEKMIGNFEKDPVFNLPQSKPHRVFSKSEYSLYDMSHRLEKLLEELKQYEQ